MAAPASNRSKSPLVAEVEALLRRRYGRDGDSVLQTHSMSVQEAGYATSGGWWSLQTALDDSDTSFQTLDISIRLNLLMAELLMYPGDAPSRSWARRYGYGSPSAASRALRGRFDVGLGDTRRMGLVGQWLVLAQRSPRTAPGLARQHEAKLRLEAYRHAVRAPDQVDVLKALGRTIPDDLAIARPRYPPIGRAELSRLTIGDGR